MKNVFVYVRPYTKFILYFELRLGCCGHACALHQPLGSEKVENG